MVQFRCIRSNGNARKRHETGNGNTGYPSCFQNGLTCFCHVSVYGFLQFRPVKRFGKPYNMDKFQISWRNNTFHSLLLFPFTARKFWFCARKISQNQLNISESLYASFLFLVHRSIFTVSCCYVLCIILLFYRIITRWWNTKARWMWLVKLSSKLEFNMRTWHF